MQITLQATPREARALLSALAFEKTRRLGISRNAIYGEEYRQEQVETVEALEQMMVIVDVAANHLSSHRFVTLDGENYRCDFCDSSSGSGPCPGPR